MTSFLWNAAKLGIYNPKALRERLIKANGVCLSTKEFDVLMKLESERYRKMFFRKYGASTWSDYYQSKLKDNPLIELYGMTPIFDPYPFKTKSYIFNQESGVYLEKTWSRANKYNLGKDLPFDFTFKP